MSWFQSFVSWAVSIDVSTRGDVLRFARQFTILYVIVGRRYSLKIESLRIVGGNNSMNMTSTACHRSSNGTEADRRGMENSNNCNCDCDNNHVQKMIRKTHGARSPKPNDPNANHMQMYTANATRHRSNGINRRICIARRREKKRHSDRLRGARLTIDHFWFLFHTISTNPASVERYVK